MRLKSLVTLLSLALIAFIIWWFQLVEDRTADLLSPDNDHFVDAFMRDFKLTAMNTTGKPGYILRAQEFNHFNDSDIADLTQPVVHLLHSDADWQLTADLGEMNDAQNQITLIHNVVVEQTPHDDSKTGMRMLTDRLNIDTQQQLMSTEKIARIEYKNLLLNSRGFSLDNISGQLKLLAEVTGVYERP